MTNKNNIILIGFMGVGKSTIAAEIVGCSNYQLLDLDAKIERDAGMSIQEIFRQNGESAFRDLESAALMALIGRSNLVVATGGGILGRPQNRMLISELGRVIYLRATFPALKSRLGLSIHRPLVKAQPDWASLEALLLSRAPLYETADLIIDTDDKDPKVIAVEILQKLTEV